MHTIKQWFIILIKTYIKSNIFEKQWNSPLNTCSAPHSLEQPPENGTFLLLILCQWRSHGAKYNLLIGREALQNWRNYLYRGASLLTVDGPACNTWHYLQKQVEVIRQWLIEDRGRWGSSFPSSGGLVALFCLFLSLAVAVIAVYKMASSL